MPCPLWMGTWITPKTCHSPACYHAKFRCSTSKSVGVSSGYPQNCSLMGSHTLGQGTRITAYKYAPPHTGYHAIFDHCWSNGTSVRMDIR